MPHSTDVIVEVNLSVLTSISPIWTRRVASTHLLNMYRIRWYHIRVLVSR